MGKEVIYYETLAGERPVKSFLDSLPAKATEKVVWTLKLLSSLDVVPVVYFSKMPGTDQIWECRTTFGSNAYRVFAFMDGHRAVLTHGLIKKTWRTPSTEIERAERYRKDYFERKKGGSIHG